jgi:hypothetical protein
MDRCLKAEGEGYERSYAAPLRRINVSCLGSSDETEPQSGQRSFASDDQRGPTSAVNVTEDLISMVPDSMGVGAAAMSI